MVSYCNPSSLARSRLHIRREKDFNMCVGLGQENSHWVNSERFLAAFQTLFQFICLSIALHVFFGTELIPISLFFFEEFKVVCSVQISEPGKQIDVPLD